MSGSEDNSKEYDRRSDDEEVSKEEKNDSESKSSTVTIHVGNLSFDTTEESLKAKFAEFGNVVTCRIPRRTRTGKSKSFGFVEFSTKEDADKAIKEMNEKEFEGRTLKIEISNGLSDKPRRGDRRNEGRRDRRRYDDYDRRDRRHDDRRSRRHEYDDYDRRERRHHDYDDYDRRDRRRDYDDDRRERRRRDYDDDRRDRY
ncbi:hypothetical protein TVAG_430980 [Trichomonas vaginalis G3]|uniref:RRM domain-containing protein n=1 Tax=Trichomonas vaginalis (strain ATCC PRA-98 / G3) TaxID=412133 RepID=A2EZD6_TRIV3|nr:peptidyl-prolyl cis-trans isomerase protein [Trichomonas vaginalis G3]EAY01957.1 hypothetical protein TVAG_430980 [Trichomonas vaginalis G3]KAI5523037.1 peptidyl-prolyl cis-trans isomerase protein [Trichomonas vaginalis G3]|eukprot:XP_001314467.1 hypothetical protein [Trichomonas vaginalis G3]